MSDTDHQTPATAALPRDTEAADAGHDAARRAAILKLSGYAACVAPAMLVVMSGRANAVPGCDNPAWNLGLSRKGHSGC